MVALEKGSRKKCKRRVGMQQRILMERSKSYTLDWSQVM